MKRKIVSYVMRSRIEQVVPHNYRIGTDVLLVPDVSVLQVGGLSGSFPFKVDMSITVIYDCGEAIVKVDMRQYHIKAPAVITIMVGQTCEVLSCSDDLRGRAIVMSRLFADSLFTGSEVTQVHNLYASMIRSPLISLDDDYRVFSQFYQLLLNVVQSPLSEFKIEAVRHLTLAMFYGYSHMKHDIVAQVRGTSRQDEIFARFLEVVANNYKDRRDVGFYARELCVTSKHLSQVVKDISGRTALDIIEEYVITEAKALLLSSAMTIQQISDHLNFPSQSVFGKYFKRLVRLSPRAYRGSIPRG